MKLTVKLGLALAAIAAFVSVAATWAWFGVGDLRLVSVGLALLTASIHWNSSRWP